MKKDTNIFERISQLADLKGFKNIPELAAFMEYNSPEKLYRLKRSPDAKPSIDIVEDFSNKFEDLDMRWFITGRGKAFPNKFVTHEPEPIYSTADKPLSDGNVYLTPQIITVDQNTGDENIVYVPTKAAAGYKNGYADREYMGTLPVFSLPGLPKNSTYRAFQVSGDSMFPTLEDNEMVIGQWLEKLEYIREDRVHIIVTKHDGVLVKRLLNRIDKYGYIIAKSDALNDRQLYPNIEIAPDDVLEVWYAVWHGGFNFKAPGDLWRKQNNLEAEVTDILRRLKQAGL